MRPQRSPPPKGCTTLAGAFFSVLFSAVLVGVFGVLLYPPLETQGWTRTDCEITTSGIRAWTDADGDTTWNAAITWEYDVGNQHFILSEHDPTAFNQALEHKEALELSERFVVRSTVPCFYDPGAPHRSVLDRAAPPWSALACGIGSLVALVTSLMMFLASLIRAGFDL